MGSRRTRRSGNTPGTQGSLSPLRREKGESNESMVSISRRESRKIDRLWGENWRLYRAARDFGRKRFSSVRAKATIVLEAGVLALAACVLNVLKKKNNFFPK